MPLPEHALTTAAMQEGSANPSVQAPGLHVVVVVVAVVMMDIELDRLTSQTSASSLAFPKKPQGFQPQGSETGLVPARTV